MKQNDHQLLHQTLQVDLTNFVSKTAQESVLLDEDTIESIWHYFHRFPSKTMVIAKLELFLNRLLWQKNKALNAQFLAHCQTFYKSCALKKDREKLKKLLEDFSHNL